MRHLKCEIDILNPIFNLMPTSYVHHVDNAYYTLTRLN